MILGGLMVRRAPSFFVVLLAIGLLGAACGSSDGGGDAPDTTFAAQGSEAVATTEAVAEPTPSFQAQLVRGGDFNSEDLYGENTVYWFWAAWCTQCRREAPNVSAAAAQFPELNFVGVPGLSIQEQMEGFIDRFDLDGFDHVVDETGSIWAAFGIPAQPAFAFIDADGNIEVVLGEMGVDDLTEKLEQLIAS